MVNELVKIIYYLIKQTGLFFDISDDYMEQILYSLSLNPKYELLFKGSVKDPFLKRIYFHDIKSYNASYSYSKLSNELKELIISLTKEIIYYFHFSEKAFEIDCKIMPMDPNQDYYVLYHQDAAYECFKNTYEWQLLTDGDIASINELSMRNQKDNISFNVPASRNTISSEHSTVKRVKIANASYAIMHGLISRKVFESKIYTLDNNMAFLDDLLDYAKIFDNIKYKRLTPGLPSIYQLKIR